MLFVSAARVRIVHEPAVRRPAADDYLLIAGLQRLLLDLGYPRIAEGRAIIRRPLEDGELRGRLGGLLDHLDAGRAGSDDRYAFALEGNVAARPADRTSTRLNSSHQCAPRIPYSA